MMLRVQEGKIVELAKKNRALNLALGVELRANLKLISHRCYLFEVAFIWELTK